jgi:D-amino-acid oxidase
MARIAIVGAGVSGLTCAVALAERGHDVTLFTDEAPEATTSAVAAAVWFPYDAEPPELVDPWALVTYGRLLELAQVPESGVSLIRFDTLATGQIEPPRWAASIGYRRLSPSSYSILAPLMDTTRYLPYLRRRSGAPLVSTHLQSLERIPSDFDVVVNCSGFGARTLVPDADVLPHRGQIVVVEKIPGARAFVLDEPLTYVIPRENDCVFGGINTEEASREPDARCSQDIVERCTRLLGLTTPPRVLHPKVGIRPFRRTGVRLEEGRLGDGRPVVHNYGHGGCGLSLSWGCAEKVVAIVEAL